MIISFRFYLINHPTHKRLVNYQVPTASPAEDYLWQHLRRQLDEACRGVIRKIEQLSEHMSQEHLLLPRRQT